MARRRIRSFALVVALIGVVLTTPVGVSGAQETVWLRWFGEGSRGATDVAADGLGGAYVAGSTGHGSPLGTFTDASLTRFDADGTLLWDRVFGTSRHDTANGVAADATGVYVVGAIGGPAPGPPSGPAADAFLAKFDANGNELWRRTFGTEGEDAANDVTVDPSGRVIVAGRFSSHDHSAFVSAYDADGSAIWTRQFGGPFATALSVDTDGSGNVFVGWMEGANAILTKLDASGNEVWGRQFGELDLAGVAVDYAGFATVAFTVATPGTTPTFASTDGLVIRLDPNGAEVWRRQFGTPEFDHMHAVAVDAAGNAYVAGDTFGTFPGEAPACNIDAFVLALGPSGAVRWVHEFGREPTSGCADADAPIDSARGVTVDDAGNVFAAGETRRGHRGSRDAFIIKIAPSPPALPVPATKDDCKRQGWRTLTDTGGRPFKNEGQCVSWVNHQRR